LSQPDITQHVTPDPDATPAVLARTTLTYLADTDQTTRGLIGHALTIALRPERFDPATLVIGGLVLLAFHADITLAHDPHKGWTFHFRTKALSQATTGTAPRDPLDVIKTTITVAGFVGAVLVGVYGYRKQRLVEGDARRADAE
jgi:hypothetical protein